MKKKADFIIIPEKPLTVEYYSGTISIEDLILAKKTLKNQAGFSLYTNYIIDFRDSHLDFKHQEISKFTDFLTKAFSKDGERKVAYITSEPNDVVLTTLYTNYINDYNLDFKTNIMSTNEAACSYFGSDIIGLDELNEIISNLKNSSNNIFD